MTHNTTVRDLMALGIPTNTAVMLHNRFVDEGDIGSDISVIATGSTTSRALADRFADALNVEDFGAVGGGVIDDTAAFVAAFAALGEAGGTVRATGKYLIDSTLTIPKNCALIGSYRNPSEQPTVGTPQSYDNLGSMLILNSAATIKLLYGTAIEGFVIKRKGMAATPWPDATVATAQIAAYAGTALTVGETLVPVHGVYIGHLLILGFTHGIKGVRAALIRVEYVGVDCTNGIDFQQIADVTQITACHAWGFLTSAGNGTWLTDVLKTRAGTAYRMSDADGCHLTNCFEYGYAIGYEIHDCYQQIVVGCGADYPPTGVSTSIGYKIHGDSSVTELIGCSAAAQGRGVLVDCGAADIPTCSISACSFFSNDSRGIETISGTTTVTGTQFGHGAGRHIAALTGTAGINIIGCTFYTLNNPIYIDASIADAKAVTVGNTFVNQTAGAGYMQRFGAGFRITDTASPVNRLTLTPGATTLPVTLLAEGESSVSLTVGTQGTTGGIYLLKGGGGVVPVYADSTNSSLEFYATGANYVRLGNGNGVHLVAGTGSAGTYVNNLRAVGSATTNQCVLLAEGTDTNIDLEVRPKGSGVLRVGTHSALAAETVTGYITIKDAGGTTRKIAVVS
jgi:hypothetical protein